MRFPRLDLWTTGKNETTGRYLMLEVGWYAFSFRLYRRELADWIRWSIAMKLPRSIALLAFVRVSACIGDIPRDYDVVYKAYEGGAGR